MTTDAATVANDNPSVDPSHAELPHWSKLWPEAPDPVGDPTKDTVWTMVRWGQKVLVDKKLTSKGNLDNLASAVHSLLVPIEPPSSSGIRAGLQFDPLTVTVAEFDSYLPELVETWRKFFWNKGAKTPSTYKSRSKRLINEFLSWCEDPAKYKCGFRRKQTANGDGATKAKKAVKKTEVQPPPSAQSDPKQTEFAFPTTPPAGGNVVRVLLDNGAMWPVPVPKDLSAADIRRMLIQLLCGIGKEDYIGEVMTLFKDNEG